MADLKSIGNSATNVLLAGSLALWAFLLAKRALGKPLLPQPALEPVSWPAVPVFATFVVAMVVPPFIVSLAGSADPLSLAAVQWRALGMAAQGLAVVGLLAVAAPVRRQDFGWNPKTLVRDVRVGATGFLASWMPVVLVNYLVEQRGWRPEGVKHLFFKILDADSGSAVLPWVAVSVVVLAPLVEELTYRVMLQGWCQSHMAPSSAIVYSALIFAFVHGFPDCLPLFPLALILGYVYHRTRSYLAVIVLHALFNGAMLTLAVLSHS